jgi:hypothetical protein
MGEPALNPKDFDDFCRPSVSLGSSEACAKVCAMMTHTPLRASAICLTLLLLPVVAFGSSAAKQPSGLPDSATLTKWIEETKQSPKGPFGAIKWFCADGTILPPKAYACAKHGGGIQHGLYIDRITKMREGGYAVANLIADLKYDQFAGEEADILTLSQILVERYLVGVDNGWLFHNAYTYRGAFQIEDEEAAAGEIVAAMMLDPAWRTPARFMMVRETVRLFPLQGDTDLASKVRNMAIQIADKDSGFAKLRAKIHGAPQREDAAAVRDYAKTKGKPDVAPLYEEIARDIESLYATAGSITAIQQLAKRTQNPEIASFLSKAAKRLESDSSPVARIEAASQLMAEIRVKFQKSQPDPSGLDLLQASLALERDAFTAGNTLLSKLSKANRRERMRWLSISSEGLYGAGFLSRRQFAGLRGEINKVASKRKIDVKRYREMLTYLARVPEWSSRWLEFNFGRAVSGFSSFEPLAHLYPQDRLRGSPVLFMGAVLDSLVLDANQLAGVRGEMFGRNIGAGLRGLNPGLARGTIHTPKNLDEIASFDREGIYLLPETVSDLPPVSGILTQGEGSSLSHVQLLARNLGIPNVVVTESLLGELRSKSGERAILAVSPGGVVQLNADGPQWDAVFGGGETEKVDTSIEIRPDLQKLDLDTTGILEISKLRATDSGRSSGPKGANLGELKFYFGEQVPDGVVIPFGTFRKVLDQPLKPGGPKVFDWMKKNYEDIEKLGSKPDAQKKKVSAFLAELRKWIANVDIGDDFNTDLRSILEQKFGPDGSYGVFVRSDTNVEDLAGFTGAGLNLTVFNVVGFDNILKAIHDVWASPFTERAYGWRQGNMSDPAYVFPAVVIQVAFPSEKSGVMVTTDVDQGVPGWLSVAVSEGVGGAVDGQATESIRVNSKTGEVQFLAQATAPQRTVLLSTGGIGMARASGTAAVLKRAEIDKLIAFAGGVTKFPSLRDEQGNELPADIEFGFKDGILAMLQIRPFVESAAAQQNQYLQQLDAGLGEREKAMVDIDAMPGTGAPAPAAQ